MYVFHVLYIYVYIYTHRLYVQKAINNHTYIHASPICATNFSGATSSAGKLLIIMRESTGLLSCAFPHDDQEQPAGKHLCASHMRMCVKAHIAAHIVAHMRVQG
jgi:hypothetical protein